MSQLSSLQIHKSNSQAGYTLFEMLVVLLVITILTQIVLVSFNSFSGGNKDRNLISLISNDLMFAQQWARTNESSINLSIDPEEHNYTIYTGLNNVIKKVDYDRDILFESGTIGLTIIYNANGNIVYSGTILMKTPRARYKFVFNLGGGRFYVTKF